MEPRNCGLVRALRHIESDRIVVSRLRCRRKRCQWCWRDWQREVKGRVLQCHTFASSSCFVFISASVTSALRQWMKRNAASFVTVPLVGGKTLILSSQCFPHSHPVRDLDRLLTYSLRHHDRNRRISSSQDVNAGKRGKPEWRFAGNYHGTIEQAAEELAAMGLHITWFHPNSFTIEGDENILESYLRLWREE